MADDIVTRLNEQAKAPALVWLADAADEIKRLRAQVSQQRTGKLLLDLERLHEEMDSLVGRINWMIDTAYAWDSDGCFTFPDGYVWRKDSGAGDQEPR